MRSPSRPTKTSRSAKLAQPAQPGALVKPTEDDKGRLRRGKILYALVIVMMLAGLTPLLVTSTILIERNREALALSEELVQLDQTRTIAKQARLYLQAMHDQVVGIAQTFGIGDKPWVVAARISRVSESDDLIRYVQDGSHVLSITVYDQRGDGAYAGYDLREEVGEYFRQSFLEGLSGRHYVSPPYVSETILDTVVVVSAPIFATNEVAGVVSVLVSLQPIQEMVEAKSHLGREVFVVDGDGRLVVHSNRETLFTKPNFSGEVMVTAFQESSGHALRLVNFEQPTESDVEAMVGTYTSIGDRSSQTAFLRALDWGAIVQAKEESGLLNGPRHRTHELQGGRILDHSGYRARGGFGGSALAADRAASGGGAPIGGG